jgi:hypothetical protein
MAATGKEKLYVSSEGGGRATVSAQEVADLAAGEAAVQSVNGQTGEVTLAAADVGAATTAQGTLADSAVQPADLGNVSALSVPTTDPADGETIWSDGGTLKVASGP